MTETIRWLRRDGRRAMREGPAGLTRRQHERLAEQVAYARAHSPYYRERYRGLPDRVADPTLLPVTSKALLMERFDDWATDREVTEARVAAFIEDPQRIGDRFLGRYLVATTSGTTGRRGLFVLDDRSLAIPTALAGRGIGAALGLGGVVRAALRGGRIAQLTAVGGHFMGYAGYRRTVRESWWRDRVIRPFSAHIPLAELVGQLNAYRPAIMIGYFSMVKLLVAEQEAGRLRINPLLVQPAGETMSAAYLERIAAVMRTTVRPIYSSTECTHLSNGCEHGWYHVNSDWAVLEPVDADHQPTPSGQWSHTVLISNLANRVQPILRYDLGDSVLARPDPCPCGSPLPAIQVQGRAGDTLTFPTDRGEHISISPLAVGTLFDRTPGIELFQVVQTAPNTLRVRLRLAPGTDPDTVWQKAHRQLTDLLADNKLDNIVIERANEPPEQAPGGKYRTVIPLT